MSVPMQARGPQRDRSLPLDSQGAAVLILLNGPGLMSCEFTPPSPDSANWFTRKQTRRACSEASPQSWGEASLLMTELRLENRVSFKEAEHGDV